MLFCYGNKRRKYFLLSHHKIDKQNVAEWPTILTWSFNFSHTGRRPRKTKFNLKHKHFVYLNLTDISSVQSSTLGNITEFKAIQNIQTKMEVELSLNNNVYF